MKIIINHNYLVLAITIFSFIILPYTAVTHAQQADFTNQSSASKEVTGYNPNLSAYFLQDINRNNGFPTYSPEQHNIPWIAGKTYQVYFVVYNSHSENWSESKGIRLAALDDAKLFGPDRIYLPSSYIVEPEGSYNFTFNVTAPNQTGKYYLKYQMICDNNSQLFGMNKTEIVIVTQAQSNNSSRPSTGHTEGSSDNGILNSLGQIIHGLFQSLGFK